MIRKTLAICLLALAPAVAMSVPIISTPTDDTGSPGEWFRHNVFHSADTAGGAGGTILAWFDLDTSMSSSWDPLTGTLDLHVNIFADSAQTTILGTAHATSGNLLGAGFGDFDDISLGLIAWSFDAGAAAALGTFGVVTDFIDHAYNSDSAGNLANTYVSDTVTLWGADGIHDGTGFFDGATIGVDMVFNVPEPGMLVLLAVGLLGIGGSTRRR